MKNYILKYFNKKFYLERIARKQLYEQLYLLCDALDSAHKPSYSGGVSNNLEESKKLLLILED